MAALDGGARLSPEQLAAVADLWSRGGRELVVRLTGRSMEPTIPSGSEVQIRCGAAVVVGDIVARRDGAGVLVHRVVAHSAADGWILTRGDARWLPDVPLSAPETALGCVSAVRRHDVFAPPPSPGASLAQRAFLWPLVAALRIHPRAGTALVRGLVETRRLVLHAATPWRRLLRGRSAAEP